MIQRGGVQATVQIPNNADTCVLDSYINSILNSHSLCLYFASKHTNIESDIFSVFPEDKEKIWNENITPMCEYLVSKYVQLYFTNTEKTTRNEVLDDIRVRIEFLHNLQSFIVEYGKPRLPTSLTYAHVIPMIESLYHEYKLLLNDDRIEESSGETAGIILEILRNTHKVLYKESSISRHEVPTTVSSSVTDIYVYYENDIMDNANRITKYKMEQFNAIYDVSINGFECTDVILDQIEIGQSETVHSVFYNLLENNVQNEDKVSHIPYKDIRFNTRECENIYDVVDKHLKKKCPAFHYKSINEGFYYPEETLGFYIPSVLHFQRIPKIPQDYTKEGIIARLSLYRNLLEEQIHTGEMFKIKYNRYISQITQVITAYQHLSHDSLEPIKSNPFSQLENIVRPSPKKVIHITRCLRKFFKNRTMSSEMELKECIHIPSSHVTYTELLPA